MNKSNRQKIFLIGIAILLFVFPTIGANWIAPENCYLFDNRIQGLLCDGFDMENPRPCPICRDESIVSVAQIMFCLGFGFLFLPFIVDGISYWQSRSANQSKLFG